MTDWPRQGRCGACGRAARQFPSGRWEHVGVPCRARSQSIWRVDDIDIREAVRFVPEGESLPTGPEGKWHTHITEVRDGYPVELGLCRDDHVTSVRAYLAAEAESREVAHG